MILSEEEKIEIENRFEEHVGQMIRLGSSFGREVPESAKSADLLLHIHFNLARLTSDLREEKIVKREEKRTEKTLSKNLESARENLQIARKGYARYELRMWDSKW